MRISVVWLSVAVLLALIALYGCAPMAHAQGFAPQWDEPKTVVVPKAKPAPKVEAPVATPPLVQIRPAGSGQKPPNMAQQIFRGGIITFGVGLMVGVMKLGLLLIGIPLI